jgi:type VI secretion system secreted protein VgrG
LSSRFTRPAANPYTNTFHARPFTQPYRKEKVLPKPRVNGVVTGKVVTPAGDDSYLDKYGRVCVQFWWDRNRPPNTPDNTLLRVAQQWAGKGWRTCFWPRVGDEVLIDFIEGDPDAPIVVGSVYNGINMPKYDPRSEYTRSGISSRSSKKRRSRECQRAPLRGSQRFRTDFHQRRARLRSSRRA